MKTHNSIKIYPPTEKSPVYKIRYKHNGIRRSESRSTLEATEKRVKEIDAGIQNGAGSLISLRQSTQEKIIAALNYLPEDTDLLQAVFEWAEAKKSLDEKVPLKDAVKFYNKFNTQNGNLTISALIDQFLIQCSKKWSDIHRRVTTNRLQRIKESLGSILVHNLDDTKIGVFFEQFSTKTPKYQNHYKALFKQLVKYAAEIKAIPDVEPLKLVLENEVECTAEPKIITPKQLDSYLRNAPEQVMPYIVLGSFAGLRPEEIYRLTWEVYHTDENNFPSYSDGITIFPLALGSQSITTAVSPSILNVSGSPRTLSRAPLTTIRQKAIVLFILIIFHSVEGVGLVFILSGRSFYSTNFKR